MAEKLRDWLFEQGFGEGLALYSAWLGLALAVVLLAAIANYVAKKFLLVGIAFVVKRSETKWDDALLRRKVFSRLSHLAPASVIYFSATLFETAQGTVERFSMVYMIFAGLLVLNSFLDALVDIYRSYDVARQKPVSDESITLAAAKWFRCSDCCPAPDLQGFYSGTRGLGSTLEQRHGTDWRLDRNALLRGRRRCH